MGFKDFIVPLSAESLRKDEGDGRFCVQNVLKITKMSEKHVLDKLDEYHDLDRGPADIIKNETFDPLYSLIYGYATISTEARQRLFDVLHRSLRALNAAIRSLPMKDGAYDQQEARLLRNALKMYTFLVHYYVEVAERNSDSGKKTSKNSKKAKSTAWSMTEKEHGVSVLIEVLELNLFALWKRPIEEDFLNLFNKVTRNMLENPANMKSKAVKQCLVALVSLLVQHYNQSVNLVPSFIHLLHGNAEAVSPIADIVTTLGKDERSAQIVGDMIRELSSDAAANARGTGSKNVATFITSIAESMPRVMLPHVSLLIGHLANEIRNGIVQVIGFLIAKAFTEEEEEEAPSHHHTKQRNALLDVLMERMHDVASYTRSKAIQTWTFLIEQRAVPKHVIPALTAEAVGRLEDKAAVVRKNALSLLTSLLQYNPYLSELRLSALSKELSEANAKLAAITHRALERSGEDCATPNSPHAMEVGDEGDDEQAEGEHASENDEMEHGEDEANGSEGDDGEETQANVAPAPQEQNEQEECDQEQSEEEKKLMKVCEYFRDACAFVESIHTAIPTVVNLLSSKTVGDVQEAIKFIVVATEFRVEAVSQATTSLLALIWSKDPTIKSAVIDAYCHLYLKPHVEGMDERASAMLIANNLISIVGAATQTELMSIAELIKELSSAKLISALTEKCLWAIFADKIDNVTPQQSRNALVVLCFIADANPDAIFNHFQMVLSEGFGDRARSDERFAQFSSLALQKLVKRSRGDKLAAPMRFQMSHPMFAKLVSVLEDDSSCLLRWFPAAEQTLNAIYLLAEHPDAICTAVIRRLHSKLRAGPAEQDRAGDATEEEPKGCAEDGAEENARCSVDSLAKLVFVVGHVAVQQLIWLEDIQVELRRRRDLKEQLVEQEAKAEASSEAIEEELGMNAASEETESEYLQAVAENELVMRNLLGSFRPLIVAICQNKDQQFGNPTLRSAATLSLAKFMCASPQFCDEHLRLLFTLLERAEEPEIRSDIIISMGDLASRHHNLVAPWTSHIFARLKDEDKSVRKNTLMVLSHLILNEVIKPKGQISDIALCMEDPEPQIAALARLFFHELANKMPRSLSLWNDTRILLSLNDQWLPLTMCTANAVYNHLPDMLSYMSSADVVSSEAFRRLMKYMFSFITLERQTESLILKLCARFRCSKDVQSWSDIAYCLSLLNYGEKALKKVLDQFKTYQNLLVHDSVYEHFVTVATKTKKCARAEMKPVIEEFEELIENAHKGENKENGENDTRQTKQVAAPKPRKKRTARRTTRRSARKTYDSSDEEDGMILESDGEDEVALLT